MATEVISVTLKLYDENIFIDNGPPHALTLIMEANLLLPVEKLWSIKNYKKH